MGNVKEEKSWVTGEIPVIGFYDMRKYKPSAMHNKNVKIKLTSKTLLYSLLYF